MTFKEYLDKRQLNEGQYKALIELGEDKNFQVFREIMEDFQMKRAYNLISGHITGGMEHEKKLRNNELLKYAGGFQLWRKGFTLVDTASELLKVLKEENND